LETCINFEHACEIIQGCQNEIRGLDRKQKKMYMLEKVRSCVVKAHMSGIHLYPTKVV
jgi:hypothetical protein